MPKELEPFPVFSRQMEDGAFAEEDGSGGGPVHPDWAVSGGVAAPLPAEFAGPAGGAGLSGLGPGRAGSGSSEEGSESVGDGETFFSSSVRSV